MPYIDKEDRTGIEKIVSELSSYILTAGDLNFTITKLFHEFLKLRGISYSRLNLLIGVLECVKLELYRQIATPYENQKKKENGPVSELDG